jgi:hypothetical protein
MATISSTSIVTSDHQFTASWALGNADTGLGVDMHRWADRTVQVVGTFGGATVLIEGSNDNSNWLTLNDSSGAALSFTATGMKVILENPLYVRASSSGGAGSAITVIIAGAGGQ